MGRIPDEIIDEVLGRTNALEVIQQYVTLKRGGTGARYKGLCPFHHEKSPSFYVDGDKGLYNCFGCGVGGNIFHFLMGIEGWTFPEAARALAARAGIVIPESDDAQDEASRRRREARQQYIELMKRARDFYEDQLWGPDGQPARAYLQERGIDEATARRFSMGYAPGGWQNLLDALATEGINPALAAQAGLAIERQQGEGHYDRFRARVLHPVVDIWGNPLAFSGRVLPGDDSPKYINSPETPYYVKGEQLFGLHTAKKGIQRRELALLVEGNFDVIALHAAGLDMAVAPMGTAFTIAQARLIKRFTRRVVIAFDGDSAGEEATIKALGPLEQCEIQAEVIRFERGDDPDSFIRREGPAALLAKIDTAQPLVAWALDRVLPSADNAPIEERLASLEQAAEVLRQVQNPIVRRHYEAELERRLNIDPKLYSRYLTQATRRQERQAPSASAGSGATPPPPERRAPQLPEPKLERREFVLLVLLLSQPAWLLAFCQEELQLMLESQELADTLDAAAQLAADRGGALDAATLLSRLPHEAMRPILTRAFASIGEFYDVEKATQMYQDTLRTLKREWADRSLSQLTRELEGLDLFTQREAYAALNTQIKQLRAFRQAQAEGDRARP